MTPKDKKLHDEIQEFNKSIKSSLHSYKFEPFKEFEARSNQQLLEKSQNLDVMKSRLAELSVNGHRSDIKSEILYAPKAKGSAKTVSVYYENLEPGDVTKAYVNHVLLKS